MRTTTSGDMVVKARRFASEYFRKHREGRHGEHPSHLAAEAIREAGKKYGIGYGPEGFCWDFGRDGITYLNMGDAYEYTVLFDSRTCQFRTGCWGDVVERLEAEGVVID